MINILLFRFCWHCFQALSLHLLTKLLAFFSEFVPTPFTPFTIDINMFNNEYFEWKVNITRTSMWPHVCVSPNLINDLLLLLFCLRRLPSPALSRATFPLLYFYWICPRLSQDLSYFHLCFEIHRIELNFAVLFPAASPHEFSLNFRTSEAT